ncbi:hypothetical protein QFZ88_005938 [Mesorhizobium sp. YL-MeA3-2017]|jgi:hypothetical protein|uniref:hypothetical protein n=1 Tax=Mesorhizobium sp. YL-MeA3-2017 TaxID=3042284 RepID=UPI0015CA610E|nr:hypothetical protein [Mesorhizobium sp. YL-MeA3-2017]MDQ0333556.1 hypothetical protein [Mesorhizobium sp. YL-MeA3-2017]
MADYHSPTVVQPSIPAVDITPLERLILGLAFDTEDDAGGVYFHSWCGPSDVVTLSVDDLRTALEASRTETESCIAKHVGMLLARHDEDAGDDPPDDIDVDLTDGDAGWDRMLQDIVRRSTTTAEIVVTTAFTCTKMRPDGFGGSVMLITAEAVRYRSTTDILEEFWNEAAKASPESQPPSPGATP